MNGWQDYQAPASTLINFLSDLVSSKELAHLAPAHPLNTGRCAAQLPAQQNIFHHPTSLPIPMVGWKFKFKIWYRHPTSLPIAKLGRKWEITLGSETAPHSFWTLSHPHIQVIPGWNQKLEMKSRQLSMLHVYRKHYCSNTWNENDSDCEHFLFMILILKKLLFGRKFFCVKSLLPFQFTPEIIFIGPMCTSGPIYGFWPI